MNESLSRKTLLSVSGSSVSNSYGPLSLKLSSGLESNLLWKAITQAQLQPVQSTPSPQPLNLDQTPNLARQKAGCKSGTALIPKKGGAVASQCAILENSHKKLLRLHQSPKRMSRPALL